MTDDEAQKALIKAAAEVGVEVSKEVYGDTLKKSLKGVGDILFGVIVPFATLANLWSGMWERFQYDIADKLKDIPAENIRDPPRNIGYPLLQAYPFIEEEPELRELFEQLLASSMNTETVINCHPAFIEMLKQLTGDEARILRAFQRAEAFPLLEVLSADRPPAGAPAAAMQIAARGPHRTVAHLFDPELVGAIERREPIAVQRSIDNLDRLGLLAVDMQRTLVDDAYKPIFASDDYQAIKASYAVGPRMLIPPNKGYISRSALGTAFINVCIGPVDQ